MNPEFIIAFKEILREELLKKNHIDIEGLGEFKVVHHEQHHKRYESGKVLLMPPADRLNFKSNIKNSNES